ncbi:MAG: ABC transporter substrate-binding protein [SAR324 cluster bacterium]|nr:ABC transporter substrate-binding protein [SAR324 cluster bacterium]
MWKIVLMVLLTMLVDNGLQAQEVEVVTTDFPPFQMQEDDKVIGITTDLVRAVIQKTGIRATLGLYPWNRAYERALNNPNILIYSIARTPEREPLFKWVGTIAPFNVYFWKLKSRTDIVLNDLEDAKKYKIGGVLSDVKTQYLIKKGFGTGTRIETVHGDHLNLQKLMTGKLDLLPFDDMTFPFKASAAGWDLSLIPAEKALFLPEISSELYMAFSRGTEDALVDRFRKALEELKAEGVPEKIKENYLPR